MKSKIVIVGEAWGAEEEKRGEPFVGAAGSVLRRALSDAGIALSDCHFTNVFNFRPTDNDLKNLCGPKSEAIEGWARPLFPGKYVQQKYKPELDRLFSEIEQHNPNLIIALGNTALWALTKQVGIKKYRGTPLLMYGTERKILPTWHPAAILRMWSNRPIMLADLMKAARQSEFPELVRPQRFIHIPESIADIEQFYNSYIAPSPRVACDIETKERTITEVGFAPSWDHALVIPFYSRRSPDGNYWPTSGSEIEAWNWVRHILATKPSHGQNYQYDMKYLWRVMRIPTPLAEDDTMILHHTLQPELEKGLGFLGSIYTDEPSWKFMRADHEDARTQKKED